MIDQLLSLDKEIFLFLNGFHTPFLDQFFLYFTHSGWLPAILLGIFFLFKNFSPRQVFIFILLIAAGVGFSDYIASGIFKPYFSRLRPCHDFLSEMTLVGNCGGKYGFASSHAANSFALFGGFSRILKNEKNIVKIFLLWAIIMCYSRVYLGVHHPGDLIVGASIGYLVSNLFYYIYTQITFQRIL